MSEKPDVKRWNPEDTIMGYNMRPDRNGDFVLSCHYDALIVERDELLALMQSTESDEKCNVVPSGYVMVPVRPTEEMLMAGYKQVPPDVLLVCAYNAMLAAAPQERGYLTVSVESLQEYEAERNELLEFLRNDIDPEWLPSSTARRLVRTLEKYND